MTISQIVRLNDIIYAIQEDGELWQVATQTYPEHWSVPDKPLQWYIDANWLIKTAFFTYDPRVAEQPPIFS